METEEQVIRGLLTKSPDDKTSLNILINTIERLSRKHISDHDALGTIFYSIGYLESILERHNLYKIEGLIKLGDK